jgi:tRNA (cytidine/uridine-2'-O-)-methyltransferase
VFNIVLVEPEIPPNTGNVGRLCLATRSTLHLIEPLGFELSDRALRRAGLDYWKEVDVRVWPSLSAFLAANSGSRVFFLSTKVKRPYFDVAFHRGDFLVFGRETKGLPEAVLRQFADHCLTIPMEGTRSLNLATAVAIVLFEAVRQMSGTSAGARV